MGKLFFSAQGRIGHEEFNKGAVILLAIHFFGWLAWFGGLAMGVIAGLLSFVLVYCWICLFAKRLHDAGKSGWIYLPIFALFLFGVWILTNIFVAMFAPEIVDINKEYQQAILGRPETMEDIKEMFKLIERMYQKAAIPMAISFLPTGALIAFGVNARLRSDPNDNQYGPAA